MEFTAVIRCRRMIRAFTTDPLPEGTADRLLKPAVRALSALLILLAVVDEGLGAVFFGPPEFADFRAAFGVPKEWTPIGAIAVGHFDPASNPVKPVFPRYRKPLAELVHRGRW